MRVRTGFVSNSSSSSFVLDKRQITSYQLGVIKDHIEQGPLLFPVLLNIGRCEPGDAWSIWETVDTLECRTYMDNFPMLTLLDCLEVPESAFLERGE